MQSSSINYENQTHLISFSVSCEPLSASLYSFLAWSATIFYSDLKTNHLKSCISHAGNKSNIESQYKILISYQCYFYQTSYKQHLIPYSIIRPKPVILLLKITKSPFILFFVFFLSFG